jgi:hypothetical protein
LLLQKRKLAIAQLGLNAGMAMGFMAMMAYTSGAKELGHVLSILTGIILGVAAALWLKAKAATVAWLASAGPAAPIVGAAIGISVAAACCSCSDSNG